MRTIVPFGAYRAGTFLPSPTLSQMDPFTLSGAKGAGKISPQPSRTSPVSTSAVCRSGLLGTLAST